ncbi:hypothetical protein D018_0677B, partial [Vibrio parahaemolyticus VP2007-007]
RRAWCPIVLVRVGKCLEGIFGAPIIIDG